MTHRWMGLLLAALLIPSLAGAAEYSSQILVDSCEELRSVDSAFDLGLGDAELDLLVRLCDRPLDLNRADRQMLIDLPEVTLELAENIVQYRMATGGFQSSLDLLQVDGMTETVFQQVKLFVKASDDYSPTVDAETGVRGRTKVSTAVTVGSGKKPEDQEAEDAKNFGAQSYLKLTGNALDAYGFGLIATHRVRTTATWDPSVGLLGSEGPTNQLDVERIFLMGREQNVSWLVGSFHAGFGEGLVFDVADKAYPRGWYSNSRVNFNSSRYRTPRMNTQSLLGGVVSLEGLDVATGWVDATAFASYQPQDIYQYSYRYGFDEYYTSDTCPAGDCEGANQCQSDSDCPLGYSCGLEGSCYSTKVGDESHQTIADGFADVVVGTNVTFSWSEYTRVGVTAYRGQSHMRAAADAEPYFAPSYNRPQRDVYGAVGLNGVLGGQAGELAAAFSVTDQGDPAAVFRGAWLGMRGLELNLSGHYYGHLYDNPFAGSEAARGQTLGSYRRNELGFRAGAVYEPWRELRSTTRLYLYHKLMLDAWRDDGVEVWFPNETDQWSLKFSQRFNIQVSKKERIRFQYEAVDRDVSQGGLYLDERVPGYEPDGYSALMTDSEAQQYVQDVYRASIPGGTSHSFGFGAGTRRFLKMSFGLDYKIKTHDAALNVLLGRYLKHSVAVRGSGPLWQNARFRAHLSWNKGRVCGPLTGSGGEEICVEEGDSNELALSGLDLDIDGGVLETDFEGDLNVSVISAYFRATLGITQKVSGYGAVSMTYTGEAYDKKSYYGFYNKLMFWVEAKI